MKPAVALGLIAAICLGLVGCGTGEVSDSQQKAKRAALQKVADEDTTHVKIPGRDR